MFDLIDVSDVLDVSLLKLFQSSCCQISAKTIGFLFRTNRNDKILRKLKSIWMSEEWRVNWATSERPMNDILRFRPTIPSNNEFKSHPYLVFWCIGRDDNHKWFPFAVIIIIQAICAKRANRSVSLLYRHISSDDGSIGALWTLYGRTIGTSQIETDPFISVETIAAKDSDSC